MGLAHEIGRLGPCSLHLGKARPQLPDRLATQLGRSIQGVRINRHLCCLFCGTPAV
jgi:hypothetical protein